MFGFLEIMSNLFVVLGYSYSFDFKQHIYAKHVLKIVKKNAFSFQPLYFCSVKLNVKHFHKRKFYWWLLLLYVKNVENCTTYSRSMSKCMKTEPIKSNLRVLILKHWTSPGWAGSDRKETPEWRAWWNPEYWGWRLYTSLRGCTPCIESSCPCQLGRKIKVLMKFPS